MGERAPAAFDGGRNNRLLAQLTPVDYEALVAGAVVTSLPHLKILYPSGLPASMAFMAERSGPVILVVDDDAAVLQIVRAALERRNGLTVLTATNGHDALKALREHNVTLLLTDVLMAGMNGTELVRQA
jgi:hypothetical protein